MRWLTALTGCFLLGAPQQLPDATWRVPPPELEATGSVLLEDLLVPLGPPERDADLGACQRGEDTRAAFPVAWAVLEVEPGEIRLSGAPVLSLDGWAVPDDLSPLRDALLAQTRQRRALGDLACWNSPHDKLLIVADARAPAGLLVRVMSAAVQAERFELSFLVSSEAPPSSPPNASSLPLCADQATVVLGVDGVREVIAESRFGDRVSGDEGRKTPLAVDEAVTTLLGWVQPGEHPLDLVVVADAQVAIHEVLHLLSTGSTRLAPARPVWARAMEDRSPEPRPAPEAISAPQGHAPTARVPVVALSVPRGGTGCQAADGEQRPSTLVSPIAPPR